MKGKLILVTWHDARFYPGTRKQDEIEDFKMALFESPGYLLSRDKQTTVIAAERNDEGDYRDIKLIPTGSIVSIQPLTVAAEE